MIDIPALLNNVWPTVVGGVAVYVGIRVDLARLHERIEAQSREIRDAKERAERAHARIDSLKGRA